MARKTAEDLAVEEVLTPEPVFDIASLIGKIVLYTAPIGFRVNRHYDLSGVTMPAIITQVSGSKETLSATLSVFIPIDPGVVFIGFVPEYRGEGQQAPYWKALGQ